MVLSWIVLLTVVASPGAVCDEERALAEATEAAESAGYDTDDAESKVLGPFDWYQYASARGFDLWDLILTQRRLMG